MSGDAKKSTRADRIGAPIDGLFAPGCHSRWVTSGDRPATVARAVCNIPSSIGAAPRVPCTMVGKNTLIAVAAVAVALLAPTLAGRIVGPREEAPAFTATAVVGDEFQKVSLADYTSQGKTVVLLFYP